MLPPTVFRKIDDRAAFLEDVGRYVGMDDDELLRVTEVCLRNLNPIDDQTAGPDADLRLVLVPELWERIRPATRYALRRLSSRLAEYDPVQDHPTLLTRRLSPETLQRLRDDADALRRSVARAAKLKIDELVERVRFAIAGSRAGDEMSPAAPAYEPGFTYRLVPALAWRVLDRKRGR